MKIVVFGATLAAIFLFLQNLFGKEKGNGKHIVSGLLVIALCFLVIIVNSAITPHSELEGDSLYLVHVILGTGFFASLLTAIAAGYATVMEKKFEHMKFPRSRPIHKYASYLAGAFLFSSLLFAAFRRIPW